MKKMIIGAIVGGLLIFIWQTLSWTVLNLHKANQQYTPKQDSIMAYLNSQFSEDGAYFLPTFPEGASMDEMNKAMEDSKGKPWAQIHYHKANNTNMVMNMVRGLLVNIVMVWLLCWILARMNKGGFSATLTACLITGLIVFLNSPYTIHIWYTVFDLNAHLIDALVSWGLAGIWLGWWMNRAGK